MGINCKLSILISTAVLATALLGCVNNGDNNYSDPDEQVNRDEQIIEVNKQLSDIKNSSDYISKDIDTRTGMMMDAISKQADSGNIKPDSIVCDNENHVITFEYNSGTLGCDIVGGFDEELEEASISPGLVRNDEMFTFSGDGPTADAVILNAITDNTEVVARCRELATEWSGSGINTKIDDTVTLDDLISLKGYEFIYFKMHGLYCRFYSSGEIAKVPCIFLQQEVSADVNRKYSDDISKNMGIGITTDNHYFVAPDFFKAHYSKGDLAGSIMFFGSCQFMGTDGNVVEDWTEVLGGISVAAFVAFHNSNYIFYNFDLVNAFMDNLVLGKTVRESFDIAIAEYGKTDEEWRINKYGRKEDNRIPAYPLLRGNEDSVLIWEEAEKKEESFYSYLRKGYDSADEYKDGLPVFYSLGGDNKKHPDNGLIWKDYTINDFDSDGENEMFMRVSFYTSDPSNESGDLFYYFEMQNGMVTQVSYCTTASSFAYDPDMTYFTDQLVIYDEREECLALYIFSEELRNKLGLREGEYLRYEAEYGSDDSTTMTRLKCSTFDVREMEEISMDEYEKESDMILSGKPLDTNINPATDKGIEKSK